MAARAASTAGTLPRGGREVVTGLDERTLAIAIVWDGLRANARR